MRVNMEQGNAQWHKLRSNKIGASDAPIIMGVSPWKNPRQLWEEKMHGNTGPKENYAMRRGKELEHCALEAYNIHTNNFSKPDVYISDEHSWMMASLDGISVDEKVIVEIKCPGKKDHGVAKEGKVPGKYFPQLQHQMKVVGVEICHYFSYVNYSDFELIVVERDNDYIAQLVEKEKEFWDSLQNFEPPAPGVDEIVVRRDDDFLSLAKEWEILQGKIEEYSKREEKVKADLIRLCGGKSCLGGGIKLLSCERKGSIDYKSIPELRDMNLEKYRKPSSSYWRVTKET